MAEDEARELATRLLLRVRRAPPDVGPLAEHIVRTIGGFPYYIHHIADRLNGIPRVVTRDDVATALDDLVFADHDPAHLAHNVERIRTYYGPDEARLSFLVLDIIAARDDATTMDQTVNLVRHKLPEATEQEVQDICQLLRTDHYLTRASGKGRAVYDFRWVVLKRWWRESRL
jgi:hypothetical protein